MPLCHLCHCPSASRAVPLAAVADPVVFSGEKSEDRRGRPALSRARCSPPRLHALRLAAVLLPDCARLRKLVMAALSHQGEVRGVPWTSRARPLAGPGSDLLSSSLRQERSLHGAAGARLGAASARGSARGRGPASERSVRRTVRAKDRLVAVASCEPVRRTRWVGSERLRGRPSRCKLAARHLSSRAGHSRSPRLTARPTRQDDTAD